MMNSSGPSLHNYRFNSGAQYLRFRLDKTLDSDFSRQSRIESVAAGAKSL
jgi:hypothetical protein